MLKNIEQVKPEDKFFSNPGEIFYLIGTVYSNTHVHYLIFLSEDGHERRYRIGDVYPYFYVKHFGSWGSTDILRLIEDEGMSHKLKDVELVQKKNPMTGDLEKLFKISAKSPNSIIQRRYSSNGLNSLFKPENVFNVAGGFHHQVLNETGFIMGMPYQFVDNKPVLYTEGLGEYEKYYKDVFKRMDDENIKLGKGIMQMIHAKRPDFRKMIIVIDIEIKANMGESMDAELAEAPITSISVTFWENEKQVTMVFTLTNQALGNEPAENPTDFDDGSFIKFLYDDEKTLLETAISAVNSLDQKIILGYNSDAFDIPYIAQRLKKNNLDLGVTGYKLKDRGYYSKWYKKWQGKYLLDLYEYFNNNNIFTGAYLSEYEDLKLNTVAEAVIGRGKYDYEGSIEEMSSEELAYYNAKDTQLTFDLATHDDNFPSFILFFIMRFGNLTLENANRRGVTAWWSGYEFRHLDNLGYYHPNEYMIDDTDGDVKGGLVLKPTKGLHYNVDVFDFSSLYPTMIIEHNICYSTLNCKHDECRSNEYIIQNREHHICTKRIGFIPAALSFLRNARIEIYKPLSKDSRYYSQLSQFVKIFMNAGYGAMKNRGFTFMCVLAAMAVTQTGRDALLELKDLIKEENGDVIYGDSVVGTEAVVVRFNDEAPMIISIRDLWHLGEQKGYFASHRVDEKEQMVIQDLSIWDGKGWNKVNRILRHYTIKSIYRTSTGVGTVDVTEDHSLVDADGNEFRPEEVNSGREPWSKPFELPKERLSSIEDIQLSLLLFLFSMCGTASDTYTGYPSQRTVAIHMSEKVRDIGKEIWDIASPAAKVFKANFKTYDSSKNKFLIKFSSHSQLWSFVRRNIYIKGEKIKPYPSVLSLPDEYLKMIYKFIKKYYFNPYLMKDGTDVTRWTMRSSSEMLLYTALANYFGDDVTVIPQPKGKIYHIWEKDYMSHKTTVSIARLLPNHVYDFETEDGTFMAGNVLCHNTDSVFTVDVNKGADKRITEIMGIEVANEGHCDMMIQHKKKNYVLVNKDKKKVKGLRGKKKDVPIFIRNMFNESIEKLTPDMSKDELIDLFVNTVINGLDRLRARDFEITDLKRVQTLSKDIDNYKVNTPIVTTAKNLMKSLEDQGKDPDFIRSLGRKGVIMEYVKTKDTWEHVSTVKKEDIDIEYYEDVFKKVFTQLTKPLGKSVEWFIENKFQQSLEEWY